LLFILLFFQSNSNSTGGAARPADKTFSLADIKQYLVPQNKWKPFPSQPAEWAKQVPDSVRKVLLNRRKNIKTNLLPVYLHPLHLNMCVMATV
jgi:hypothetical protein